MAIQVVCNCGARYSVNESLAGKRCKCQKCQGVILVPAAGAQVARIPVQCSNCGKSFLVTAAMAGRQGQCNQCGGVLNVPGGAAAPANDPAAANLNIASGNLASYNVPPWGAPQFGGMASDALSNPLSDPWSNPVGAMPAGGPMGAGYPQPYGQASAGMGAPGFGFGMAPQAAAGKRSNGKKLALIIGGSAGGVVLLLLIVVLVLTMRGGGGAVNPFPNAEPGSDEDRENLKARLVYYDGQFQRRNHGTVYDMCAEEGKQKWDQLAKEHFERLTESQKATCQGKTGRDFFVAVRKFTSGKTTAKLVVNEVTVNGDSGRLVYEYEGERLRYFQHARRMNGQWMFTTSSIGSSSPRTATALATPTQTPDAQAQTASPTQPAKNSPPSSNPNSPQPGANATPSSNVNPSQALGPREQFDGFTLVIPPPWKRVPPDREGTIMKLVCPVPAPKPKTSIMEVEIETQTTSTAMELAKQWAKESGNQLMKELPINVGGLVGVQVLITNRAETESPPYVAVFVLHGGKTYRFTLSGTTNGFDFYKLCSQVRWNEK